MPRKTAKKKVKKKPAKKIAKRKVKKKSVVPTGKLLENKVVVAKGFEDFEEKSFGKRQGKTLVLAYTEALYLLDRGKLAVKKAGKKVKFQTLMDYALKNDRRIHEKYIVYKDLRDRGFVVKTGFKFGCDFRVYSRGVSVKRGPKKTGEHTKWVVYAIPEDYTHSFAELSRAVRLAHSIRARMLWAIVDNEQDVTYLEVLRLKP